MRDLSEEAINQLSTQLIRLGDIIGDGDLSASEKKYYNNEYKKIMKVLHPEAFPKKKRFPSQVLIRQLKPCDCGEVGWRCARSKQGMQILCKKCPRKSEVLPTNKEAVISWNNTFTTVNNSVDK